MISERLAVARRLELSEAVESGDRIEGLFARVKVTLEDHGLERTLRMDLGRPVKWESISSRGKEINDPDVVATSDPEFDEAITVLAEDGAAQYVRHLFGYPGLRKLTREFFVRFPLAAFKGGTLVIPHLEGGNPETTAGLQLGSKLVLLLREAIEATPAVAPEPPPVVVFGPSWTESPTSERARPEEVHPDDAPFIKPQVDKAWMALAALPLVLGTIMFHEVIGIGGVTIAAVLLALMIKSIFSGR